MSDDTNSDFDPRFDPAFQRGFDTAIPVAESVPASAPSVAAPPAAAPAESVAAPAPARPVTPPVSEKAAAPAPVPAVADDAPLLVDQALLLPESTPARSSRNPFLLVLFIAAIVLIAGGIWMLVQAGDAFNSSQVRSQGDFNTLTSTIDFAPFVSLLGVATLIGLLFVFANSWRKRH